MAAEVMMLAVVAEALAAAAVAGVVAGKREERWTLLAVSSKADMDQELAESDLYCLNSVLSRITGRRPRKVNSHIHCVTIRHYCLLDRLRLLALLSILSRSDDTKGSDSEVSKG